MHSPERLSNCLNYGTFGDKIMTRHVQQEDALGCQIACAAMIVGCSYAEAREVIAPNWSGELPPGRFEVEAFIKSRGWDVINNREHFYDFRRSEGDGFPWPPSPFAELHLVSVRTISVNFYSHAVVMLRDGSILDPDVQEPNTMADYPLVLQVSAVVRR